MFRRREEGLFDNSTDPNQPEASEGASQSNASGSSNSMHSGAPQPAYLQSASQPQQSAPRAPESRPSAQAPQPASSFRPASPSTPISSDLSRGRMPESKTSSMPTSSNPSVGSSAGNFGSKSNSGKRVLTVGNDILLKGEIATCDRLVIEGRVDATLNDVHTVEIAETGSFKGAAHIEDAEISGLFEGDLIVRNRLVIYATGKVRGKITYGEIEIERGGEISGEIKTNNASSQSQGASRPARAKEEKVAA